VTDVATPSSPAAARERRFRRLEPAAVLGVMSRDATVFVRYWRSTTFTSVLEPTVYLLGLGLGLGTLIKRVGGLTYIQFVGTGIVGNAVLFASVLPAIKSHVRSRAWTPWGKVEVRAAALGAHAALLGALPLLEGA